MHLQDVAANLVIDAKPYGRAMGRDDGGIDIEQMRLFFDQMSPYARKASGAIHRADRTVAFKLQPRKRDRSAIRDRDTAMLSFEPATVFSSRHLADIFSTAPMRAIFGERHSLESMLAVEAALAKVKHSSV